MPYLLFAQKNKLNYIELEKNFMLTMGCTPDCNIILPQNAASHFRVYSEKSGNWLLENLAYSNNDSRRFIPLGNGDMIDLNSLTITFLENITGLNASPFEGTISLSAGQKIGEYTIINLLNKTKWGSLYLAKDGENQEFALKIFNKVLTQNEADGFYEQIRQTRKLSAKGITPYHTYGVFHRQAYYVTDYCAHTNLGFRISAKAPMDETEALGIIRKLAEILRLAQFETGVFHGGLEPAVILYNNEERIRITEFGLFFWKSEVLNNGCAAISPWYISPEEITGEEISFRSDFYTLGVILFQMLTGVLPFHSEDHNRLFDMHLHEKFPLPMDRNPNVKISAGALQLLLKMTARKPADRFRSWDELLDAANYAIEPDHPLPPLREDASSDLPNASTLKLKSSIS